MPDAPGVGERDFHEFTVKFEPFLLTGDVLKDLAVRQCEFVAAFRLARTYGRAGNPEMAKKIMDSVKRSPSRPEEREWSLKMACKRMREIQARNHERRLQGLPPFEPPDPSIH